MATSVVALTRPAVEPTDRVAVLEAQVADLVRQLVAIEARLPPERFELPAGWISVKEAAHTSGFKTPTLYGWLRKGKIKGAPLGGRRFIDPSSLPKRA